MFVRICLCDIILYTWFGKRWKRLKKFWSWKICLVYPYFFKHLSLSMPISFMLIEKRVYALSPWGTFQMNFFFRWSLQCCKTRQMSQGISKLIKKVLKFDLFAAGVGANHKFHLLLNKYVLSLVLEYFIAVYDQTLSARVNLKNSIVQI